MSASAPMDSLRRISEELTRRSRFLITSHARPDGDSIGSQVAIAAALRAMGKSVRLVNRDAPPPAYLAFPGVSAIEVANHVEGDYDAVIVLECSDITRPGVAGLDKYFVINIDHHAGNAQYGAVNYYDEGAAACGELVADVIDVLDMPWSVEIGIALYLTILTDTGSFRHGSMTSRTFEVCRRAADAGANPAAIATTVFDSSSVGKLKLIGAVLDTMHIDCDGRLAVLEYSDRLLAETGTTVYDTDGVINMPFMASSIEAVALVRAEGTRQVRVSLRSKGDLDVRAIAGLFGGGGHRNASGFTVEGDAAVVREQVVGLLKQALGVAQPSPA